VRAGLVGPSITVPFVEGSPHLGKSRTSVFATSMPGRAERQLIVQVMGV